MRSFAPLCRRTVDAASGGGILFARFRRKIVTGRSMRPATEGTAHALGPACGRMMAPSHAPSALGRAGPGGSALDLAGRTADDDGLTDILLGVGAG
jgi:hypothetical protein